MLPLLYRKAHELKVATGSAQSNQYYEYRVYWKKHKLYREPCAPEHSQHMAWTHSCAIPSILSWHCTQYRHCTMCCASRYPPAKKERPLKSLPLEGGDGKYSRRSQILSFSLYFSTRPHICKSYSCFFHLFFLRKCAEPRYLPIQNLEKIFSRRSGSAYSPVIRPNASNALRRGIAARSQRCSASSVIASGNACMTHSNSAA